MPSRPQCLVCDAPMPAAKRPGRCRDCKRERVNGQRRQPRRDLGGRRASEGKSARALADPVGWAAHLDRLAERAAAQLPLFD